MTPVILSGGSGTRLWPVSRESYPKQFCEFFDRSFLLNTWERVKPIGDPMVVTLSDMGALTHQTLKNAGLTKEKLVLEPMAKNTAAAVALSCVVLERAGKIDEVAGVFPADHLIENEEAFVQSVKLAEQAAQKGFLVTLGITPRYPSTGFGYIECSNDIVAEGPNNISAVKVDSFREKPNLETAREYVESGRYAWNAGMFIFKVSDMIELFKKHLPDSWDRLQRIEPDFSNVKHVYANLESISIDHAIAEKVKNLACIPADMGWSDVGSWDEISRLSEEAEGLTIDSKAQVFRENSTSSFVYSQSNKAVGLIDVEDLIIVDTADALLVTKKGKSEDVRDIVKSIREAGLPMAMEHPFENRPWGKFEVLKDDPEFKLKKITVEPGEKLSYQSHEKRDETWVLIKGKAEFTLDDEVRELKKGDVVVIPRQSKHRIGNIGQEPMVFVEVQTGDYFGEDDIKRYQDDYQRA